MTDAGRLWVGEEEEGGRGSEDSLSASCNRHGWRARNRAEGRWDE